MSKERSEDREMKKLKTELTEVIDQRIDYNNGFANLLRGDYSLFIALIALFISLYAAWERGFLVRHYVPTLYLVLVIWLWYSIRSASRAPEKGLDIDPEEQKPSVDWYLSWAKPLFRSLWTLSLLCIIVLLIIAEKRWWMWLPAILFAILLPLITRVEPSTASSDGNDENEEKRKIKVSGTIPTIIFLLILAIVVIYPYYRIVRELIFIVLETPYSFSEIILTIILILVALASLSEHLSLKFIAADVSNQNYTLSLLRSEIDEFGDVETLEEKRKEVLKLCFPKADSFLLFFNYYGLMFTRYTFEIAEEEED